MSGLVLWKDFPLPLDVVTQKLAWLGRTGSGKTYGAMKLSELMLEHHAQIIALDPVGVWHGLRLGPRPFAVPVLGGLHGDIPLDPSSGALIAETIMSRRISAVIDVSQMVGTEPARFATAFAERLFQLCKASPTAVHLFLEECQEFVPQNTTKGLGQERMLHEFQRVVKIGRNFGIGVSLISQRPQEVNKKVLNQTECLFAFQTTGPQERKTLEWWVKDKGVDDDVAAILPKLDVGRAHVWSPQWLKFRGVVEILKKRTADVSSTPKVGGAKTKAEELSPIDLDQLRHEMAAMTAQAKADDPKALRARIAELEKQLKGAPASRIERVDVPVFDERQFVEMHAQIFEDIDHVEAALSAAKSAVGQSLNAYRRHQAESAAVTRPSPGKSAPLVIQPPQGLEPPYRLKPKASTGSGDSSLGKCERAIMIAFAQSDRPLSMVQAAIIAGYRPSSGGVSAALAALRAAGYVEGSGPSISTTAAGLKALGSFDPLPTGSALAEHWYGMLGKAEAEILRVIVKAHPRSVPIAKAAELCGYRPTSGGVSAAMAKLRKLDLVSGGGDGLVADERLVD